MLDPAEVWDDFPPGGPDKTFAELLALEESDRLALDRFNLGSTIDGEP